MATKYNFKGKAIEDLKKMSLEEYSKIVNSRIRRSIKRGLTEQQKTLMATMRSGEDFIKTHCRDMIIIPEMVGKKFGVYNGKEFISVDITPEMLGHYLGEFAMTRRDIKHSAPGFGATKSSKFIPLK